MDTSTQFAAIAESAQPCWPRTPALSPLVRRLIHPQADSGRRRLRHMLTQLPDERLRIGLGLSDTDIVALRSGRTENTAAVAAAAASTPAKRRVPAAARRSHDSRTSPSSA